MCKAEPVLLNQTFPGDVNGDLRINSRDLNKLLTAYGLRSDNPNCCIDDTRKIDPIHLYMLLSHYGWHYL
jgi:hypothetical protein